MHMEYPQEYKYQGFEAEEQLLGHKLPWEKILKENNISPDRRTRKEWQQILQHIYPENPIVPNKKWGKDLYDFTADKLELDIDDIESLKFYNSLGTDVDRMGVDCFFVFKNPQTGKEAVFNIDLTTNLQKDEAKSDLIIHAQQIPDYNKNENGYIAEMKKIAELIAKDLKSKTEETIYQNKLN